MQKLIILLITIFIFNYGRGQEFVFSSKSMHDGYVYPEWKVKDDLVGKSYEDAVVVRTKSILLGDGLGGSEGYAGLYSHYQCLLLSDFLQNMISEVKDETALKEIVVKQINKNNYQIDSKTTINKSASTLVYLYLKDKFLYTGVVGDSGYSIFRFSESQNQLLLNYRSDESISSFNSPLCIYFGEDYKIQPNKHKVEGGDVVFTASDGLLDVLPYSFIVAALNFLVAKMIIAYDNGEDINENSYDLGDLLESYIANLHQVSVKYGNQIKKLIKDELKADYEREIQSMKPTRFSIFFGCHASKLKSKRKKYQNNLMAYEDFMESPPLSSNERKDMLKKMYENEIENEFSPFVYDDKEIKKGQKIKQRVENYISSRVIEFDQPTKFDCETLEKLTNIFVPSEKKPQIFDECVLKAIPRLPNNTDIEKITKSYNSKYVNRNLGLAAKFMSIDPRDKIDDYHIKEMKSLESKYQNTPLIIKYTSIHRQMPLKAKVDDISVATAVMIKKPKITDNKITKMEKEAENVRNTESSNYVAKILQQINKLESRLNLVI